MSLSRYDEPAGGRAVWLMTLADLALLLVGFFVFLQASRIDSATLASAIRQGFDGTPAAETAPLPITLDRAAVRGFAPASASLPPIAAAARWVRQAARDRRTELRITGHAGDTRDDRDPLTDSAALLASDRARAVAAALVGTGAIDRDRIVLSTRTTSTGRHVTLAIGYAGDERQAIAARQPPLAASRSIP